MPFGQQLELATELSTKLGNKVLLSLDPFELLTEEGLDQWQSLLSRVDLFFVSEDEVTSRKIRLDPQPFLRQLLVGRLGTILFKQGKTGGLVLRSGEAPNLRWQGRADRVEDTTGAGDAFACGVLAGLIRARAHGAGPTEGSRLRQLRHRGARCGSAARRDSHRRTRASRSLVSRIIPPLGVVLDRSFSQYAMGSNTKLLRRNSCTRKASSY